MEIQTKDHYIRSVLRRIMKKLFIISLLLFSIKSWGQTPVLDSLKSVVKKLSAQMVSVERDSLLTVSMYTICTTISLTEPDLRQTWTDSLSKFSKTSTWEQSVAYNYLANGRNFHFNGYSTIAIKELELSIGLFRRYRNDKMYSFVFSMLAVIITNYLYNKPIADEATERKYLSYLLEALEMAKKQGNLAQIANMNLSLMQYYMRIKNYEEARKRCIRAWEITKNDPEKYFYFHYAGKFLEGLNLLYLNKQKEGFNLINQTKAIAQKPRKDGMEKYFWANDGLTLGNYYVEKRDYKNAILEAKIAEDALRSMKISNFDYALNKIFYQAYKNTNRPIEALQYFEKMNQYEQEAQHKETLGQYLEFQTKYEDEKQKNQIQALENQKLTQTRNFLSLAGLLSLGIIGYIFYNNRKLKKKNEEIQTALLQGQTMERKRMASELHDNISNKILGVKMRVEMLENEHFTEKEKTNYEATLGFIDEVYSDVRLVSHNLLPEELETKGLGVAVESLVKKINLIGKTHFENSFEPLQSRFSPRLEYELYTVVLELVNNILRHAEAKNALISIFQENNLLKICVKDNGKGFDNQMVSFDSLGLKSIHSRIEALRGKVDILTNNGTEVLIEVPV